MSSLATNKRRAERGAAVDLKDTKEGLSTVCANSRRQSVNYVSRVCNDITVLWTIIQGGPRLQLFAEPIRMDRRTIRLVPVRSPAPARTAGQIS
jgi:hypothetical protein